MSDKCTICNNKNESDDWIQCDICLDWFHTPCVRLLASDVKDLHSYHCVECARDHGPLVQRRKLKRTKTKIDYIALDQGEVFAVDKEVHPHLHKFLQYTPDASCIDITDELTADYALRTRLTKPVLVPRAASRGIGGMKFPQNPTDITIDYIAECVGDDEPVEVMDVLSQQGSGGWTMGRWRDYFKTEKSDRDRIRNVISLEISQVEGLGRDFVRPQMVRDLDILDTVWNDDVLGEKPQVSKYCLMSVLGSYTDFHIDFGGTSVYYTVCSGSKTFLMFPPTEHNLQLYESWCLEEHQNFMWFPEYTIGRKSRGKLSFATGGFAVTLSPGDLFIIPSGWIHAVHTPVDSIVIGGNFLTFMNLATQVRINQIERSTKVPPKFRFPQFNRVLWLAAAHLVFHSTINLLPGPLKQHSDDDSIVGEPRDPIADNGSAQTAIHELYQHLCWHYELSKSNKVARASIPISTVGKDIPQFLSQLSQFSQPL